MYNSFASYFNSKTTSTVFDYFRLEYPMYKHIACKQYRKFD